MLPVLALTFPSIESFACLPSWDAHCRERNTLSLKMSPGIFTQSPLDIATTLLKTVRLRLPAGIWVLCVSYKGLLRTGYKNLPARHLSCLVWRPG